MDASFDDALDVVLDTALRELRRQRDQLANEAKDLRCQLAQLRGAVFWAVKNFSTAMC